MRTRRRSLGEVIETAEPAQRAVARRGQPKLLAELLGAAGVVTVDDVVRADVGVLVDF